MSEPVYRDSLERYKAVLVSIGASPEVLACADRAIERAPVRPAGLTQDQRNAIDTGLKALGKELRKRPDPVTEQPDARALAEALGLTATPGDLKRIASALSAAREEAEKRARDLDAQIAVLADVLMEEFGGPTRSESACEMAVRVLRELREQLAASESRLRELAEAALRYDAAIQRAARHGNSWVDSGPDDPDLDSLYEDWLARARSHSGETPDTRTTNEKEP